ncbi:MULTISPECIES: PilN domain-containing protein [unclassified Halomonas]|uniref:PilN domain-containing protein n=1 Tax=unclassified Halomonas TaxID=2609666 RepID=UPI001BE77D08|nr:MULTISPECIES: PilN domain-containing protein [unclassified Halomonas]MBT2786705.1 fimbrial assembly protein [Halomonas sp. ISL-106]MBT2798643.1 fimbrial assembly protein [Halomonas sp. ISL-104]
MSININLLPWREAQRERRTRKFYLAVASMLVLGLVLGLLISQLYQLKLAAQQQRNAYISDHIERLNADIDGVSRYASDAERLGEQIAVFQSLQSERTDAVQLFNDVAASVANGVIYQRLAKNGNRVSVTAVADGERQVSEQLRRITALPSLGVPALSAVESDQNGLGRVFRFDVEQTTAALLQGVEEALP